MSTFEVLHQPVCEICHDFALLVGLYGDPAGVEQLNRRKMGGIFAGLQGTLSNALIINISRLLDPAATGKKGNASFEAAIRELKIPESDPRRVAVERRLDALRAQATTIQEHRNKRVAHNDHAVATGATKLAAVFLRDLRAAKEGVVELYRELSLLHGTDWTVEILEEDTASDAGRLIEILKAGNDALDAAREERFRKMIARVGSPKN